MDPLVKRNPGLWPRSPDYAASGSIRATTMGFNGTVRNISSLIKSQNEDIVNSYYFNSALRQSCRL